MGSFNTTCFASNQTIATKDKCRVVPISQRSSYQPAKLTLGDKELELYGIANSNCYANCYWQPECGFLPAVYDDYGQVKLQLDDYSRSNLLNFFEDVRRDCPVVEAGKNTAHDIAFDFKAFLVASAPGIEALLSPRGPYAGPIIIEGDALDADIVACWESIWASAQQNRLFIRTGGGAIRPLQFAILHERSYLALVARLAAAKSWSDESYDQVTFLRTAFAKAKAFGDSMVEKAKARAEKDPTERDNTAWTRAWSFSEDLGGSLRRLDNGDCYRHAVESSTHRKLSEGYLAGTVSEDAFIQALLPMLNDRYAMASVTGLNLRFTPLVFSGQDSENRLGQDYAAFVASVSPQVTRDRRIEMHGDYHTYSMDVPSLETISELKAMLEEDSLDLQGLVVSSTDSGHRIQFSCQRTLKGMRYQLKEFANSAFLLASLTELPALG